MKTVFITGAAQGIGLETAKKYAAAGWFVGLYDINEKGIEELLKTAEFSNACGCVCDVTSRDSIAAALEHFSQQTNGRLDALINNAGVLSGGDFSTMEQKPIQMMININVQGLTNVAQLAFPMLKQTENSVMVNVSSASSIYGFPSLAVYSATKFYVRGLTEALNIEWEKYGIRVTCVKPPYVQTGMFDNVPRESAKKIEAEFTPIQIAEVIFKAAQGNKVGHIIGWKIKLWNFLVRLFPESIGKSLTRYLTNQ